MDTRPKGQEPFTGSQWLILVSLASIQFLNILDFIVVMPLGPRFLDDMRLSADQFGYVVAIYGYASAAAGLLAAGWINRTERRVTMLIMLALFACSSILCYLATDFGSLLVARSLTGACGGLIGSIVLSITSDVFPESRRGFALGIIMTSFSMASVIGVPLGLWLAERAASARSPFLYLAMACIPLWFALYATLPRIARQHTGTADGYWKTMSEVVRARSHQWAFLFNAVLVFQTFLIVPFLATFCVKNLGLPHHLLKYVYIVGGACTFVTMPLVGRIADRIGKPITYVWVACLSIVPTVWIPSLPPLAPWVTIAVITLYMVLSSARMVPGQSMISSVPASRWRAGFLSVATSVQSLSTGIAASISANIVRVSPHGELEKLWIAGWLGAGFFALSLLLVPKLRPASESDCLPPS
jgi:predicted MFS family arabinose efflux permease